MTDQNRRDLLELQGDRYDTRTTLITSQLPTSSCHDYIDDPTLADAILDRFIHNAHHLNLNGDSLKKTRTPLTNTPQTSHS
jgi:DNA replication protein